jgi:hypothetical protein
MTSGRVAGAWEAVWYLGGTVPLSEHEQRQLEQIEQALYADYPKLAQKLRAQDPRVHYQRRVVLAVIVFLLGAGLLVAGTLVQVIPAGAGGLVAAGLVAMLGGAMWAVASWRHLGGFAGGSGRRAGRTRGPGRRPPGTVPWAGRPVGRGWRRARDRSGLTFMERLEERWRRRQEGRY